MKGRCNVNVKFSLLVIAYLEVRGRCPVPGSNFGPSHSAGRFAVASVCDEDRRASASPPETPVRPRRCSSGRPACLAAAQPRRRWPRTRATSSAKRCGLESASFGDLAGAARAAADGLLPFIDVDHSWSSADGIFGPSVRAPACTASARAFSGYMLHRRRWLAGELGHRARPAAGARFRAGTLPGRLSGRRGPQGS